MSYALEVAALVVLEAAKMGPFSGVHEGLIL